MVGVSGEGISVYVRRYPDGVPVFMGQTWATNSVVVTPSGCPGPVVSNWYSGALSVTNRSIGANYALRTNGVIASVQWVGAGGVAQWNWGDSNYASVDVVRLNSDNAVEETFGMSIATNSTPVATGYTSTYGWGGVVWSGGTGGVSSAEAPAAIYDALVGLRDDVRQGLDQVADGVEALGAQSVQVSVTNHLSALSTNDYAWSRGVAESLAGSLTNGLTLTREGAESVSAPYAQSVIDWFDQLAGLSTPQIDEGSTPAMSVMVAGYTFDLSPFQGELSEIWYFARMFLAWLIAMGYFVLVVKEAFEVVPVLAAARGTVAPAANATIFGVGADWGVALIPVLVVVVLALLGACIGTIITRLTGLTGMWAYIYSGGPLAGASGGSALHVGVEWLKHVVPFGVLVQGLASYIAFRALMLKASVICVFAFRAIPAH